MSERFSVPEGMLNAGVSTFRKCFPVGDCSRISPEVFELVFEAILAWQAENAPMPSDNVITELISEARGNYAGTRSQLRYQLTQWIRRMYITPEIKVPQEIYDMARDTYQGLAEMTIGEALAEWHSRIEKVAVESYRQGKESR